MKQVKPTIYDQDYYQRVYGPITTTSKSANLSLANYHQDIIKISPPQKNQFVVDFGCGNGNLSFYLSQKYPIKVLGIDYSPSAIKICQTRLKNLKTHTNVKPNLSFKNSNNDKLPHLKGVDAVYLCDVVEHMYDQEIKTVFRKFLTWNPKIKIVIHTDNRLYLSYVRPFFDVVNLLLGNTTLNLLKQRQVAEDQVHINLTTPHLFKRKMKQLGLEEIRRSYPTIITSRVSSQLGPLTRIPFLTSIVAISLRYFGFLSPSFFTVYQVRV